MGFDTIELDVASLGLPEETLLRYVRLIKSGGLRAKPQFSVKFNKSDIAFTGDRAFGAYVIPAPQTTGMLVSSGLYLFLLFSFFLLLASGTVTTVRSSYKLFS